MKLFWPENPCQPSVPNQNGGSIQAGGAARAATVWIR